MLAGQYLWGQAKIFGLLGIGAARSVCSRAAEKICSTLGLRGKPSAAMLLRRDNVDK
jgi:hypothetical protein